MKCGNEKSDLFFQTCSSQLNISIVTGAIGSSLYKGSKLYYEGNKHRHQISSVFINFCLEKLLIESQVLYVQQQPHQLQHRLAHHKLVQHKLAHLQPNLLHNTYLRVGYFGKV